jgi:hypothetical protein
MPDCGPFSTENEVFELHREDWLRSHAGEFVAIQDKAVAEGFFRTYADALKAGLQAFGVKRHFLVKQILETEPEYFVL